MYRRSGFCFCFVVTKRRKSSGKGILCKKKPDLRLGKRETYSATGSKVLRDTGLLWIVRRVLDPRVSPCRDVANYRLSGELGRVAGCCPVAAQTSVVWVPGAVLVVLRVPSVSHPNGPVSGSIRPRASAVRRRGVGRAAAHVAAVQSSSRAHGAQDFAVGSRRATVHEGIAGSASVRDTAAGRRSGVRISATGAASRHGRRCLPRRRACERRGSPSSVPRSTVLRGRGGDSGNRRVGIGVVTVLLDLLSPFLLGILALLPLAPQENSCKNQERHGRDRNHHGYGNLPSTAQARAR